ncbi:MAG: hypothetical protein Ct9H90mP20_6040 [Candidatus Neomarinimicrobiota bacterium]|nr:MAG: hypothetical protein Ct9H90mP20_6040 [Candidatus Neomarinimicrobiota bacterium]
MIFVNYDWNINSTKLVDRIRNEVSVLLVAVIGTDMILLTIWLWS